MAHNAPQATGPSKLVIRNIGLLLSGALEKPILDADTIVAENGKITAIGRLKNLDTDGATTTIDANGTTVTPGAFRQSEMKDDQITLSAAPAFASASAKTSISASRAMGPTSAPITLVVGSCSRSNV